MVYIITIDGQQTAVASLAEVRAFQQGAIIDGCAVKVDRVRLSSIILPSGPWARPRDIVRAWNAEHRS